MPFRKNSQREEALLKHWRQGETVKVASLFTGIPEGTVSHYYARFSKKRDVYGKVSEKGYQEPPRTSPLDAAFANVSFANAYGIVNQLVGAGEYAKARDYLQTILLLHDLEKLMLPIAQNVDPKKSNEVLQYMALLTKMITGATLTEKKAEPTESSPRTAATTGSD